MRLTIINVKSVFFFSLMACCILQFSACSLLPVTPDRVNQLAEQQRFDDAIASYEKLKEEDKTTVNIKNIQRSKSSYESTQVKKIKDSISRNEYRQAHEQFDIANDNIPSSDKIKSLQEYIEANEQAFHYKRVLQYQKREAEFYLDEKPILEELYQVQDNNRKYLKLYKNRIKDRSKLAEELGNKGLAEINKANTSTAYDLLSLANELENDPRWSQALNTLNKQRKKKKAVAKKQQVKQDKSEFQVLQEKYNKLDHDKALIASQKLLKKIGHLRLSANDKAWYKKEDAELQKLIKQYVARGNQRGQVLYSKGKIEESISVWKDAYQLDPNNRQLKDNIDRAETFLKKFNELNEK